MSIEVNKIDAVVQDKTRTKRQPLLRFLRFFAIFIACLCLFLWYIGVFGGNVHEVVKGQAYRSAELTGANLQRVLASDHIRSVINLRGGSPKDRWYRSEIAVTKAAGADHYDVTLSSSHLPDPKRLIQLLSTFDHARYPVIWHCQAGADRAGLVGTIYLNVYQNVPLNQAEDRQLTWHYGHFRFGDTHAMNDFFNLYRSTNSGLSLRQWINTKYPTLYKQNGG